MLNEAAERIRLLAGEDSWVLLGGIDAVATDLHRRLDKQLASRSTVIPLDINDGEAHLAEAAREHVSRLRSTEDLRSVDDILSAKAAGGTGAVGLRQIDEALLNGQVHALYLTTKFVSEHAEGAESAIRRAFDEGATVEHVSGEAADRLDAAGGIAARLRFVIKPVERVERDTGAEKQRSAEATRGT
jgi:stalled ribosome rescue protein Dom34